MTVKHHLANARSRVGRRRRRSWCGRWRRGCRGRGRCSQRSADGITAGRAVAWLRALSETWRAAEVPAERADLLRAIYDRITVAGRGIVSVRLTPSAYAHGFALAPPEKVELARRTGVGRAISTYTIPIEGRDEWLAAARRLA
jgi:hypothetical protein